MAIDHRFEHRLPHSDRPGLGFTSPRLVAKLAASPTYAGDMQSRDVASHTPRAETMDRVLTLLDERILQIERERTYIGSKRLDPLAAVRLELGAREPIGPSVRPTGG